MEIDCTIFKPSGKWYTDESVEIDDVTEDYNLPLEIKKKARLRNMTYLCHGSQHNVPMLIYVGD